MVIIEILSLSGYREWFVHYGVFPRHIETWWHIFSMPFIHLSPSHSLGNLSILSVLIAVMAFRDARLFLLASLFIISFGGMGLWLFGRPALHVGASGWIFGLWAFTILRGFLGHCWRDVLVGFLVVLLYWRLVAGLFPQTNTISVEGHWFGALAGVVFGFLPVRRSIPNNVKRD